MKVKASWLWEAACWGLIGAALACYNKSVRIAVREESDAGSWERAVEDEKAKAPDGV